MAENNLSSSVMHTLVVCSNEGCNETVNRRDKETHETEECKFRKITCESCGEELVYVDYEKHNCTLRKKMDEVKSRLDELTESLNRILLTQGEMLAAHDQSIKNLQNPQRHVSTMTFQREPTVVVSGLIFVIGGHGRFDDDQSSKSLEIFSWMRRTWTLFEDSVCQRINSFSFLYQKKIMICGGDCTKRIEYLSRSENGYTSTVASVSLPDNARYNGLLYEDRILTFHKDVVETSLESPRESRTLLTGEESRSVPAGVHCFGNDIYIVRGSESSMEKYDVVTNKMETLLPLPYKVSNMATVAYRDDIIILGGQDDNSRPLNNVSMYNIHSQECTRLPSMLEKRTNCTSVIMGDVIVVMGGESENDDGRFFLNTVEYFVMGTNTWQELPPMNLLRLGATACAYV